MLTIELPQRHGWMLTGQRGHAEHVHELWRSSEEGRRPDVRCLDAESCRYGAGEHLCSACFMLLHVWYPSCFPTTHAAEHWYPRRRERHRAPAHATSPVDVVDLIAPAATPPAPAATPARMGRLSIGGACGPKISVGGHLVVVKKLSFASNSIAVAVAGRPEIVVTDQKTEIVPGVFVQTSTKTGGNRLVFTAPREILINRIEDHRKH
jgi:hypothetical protein